MATDWNKWFLGLAEYVSTASKDPSTKVGAVIVDDERRVVSLGYNGLPRGVDDTEERLNNRDLKYRIIVHAERNSLLFARGSVKGCTIYTYPDQRSQKGRYLSGPQEPIRTCDS